MAVTDPCDQIRIDPFLRWAGSKRQMVPMLAQFWDPTYSRYVEPFAGCAALYFHIQPRSAVLGDSNAELMEAYRTLRENPDTLHAALSALPKRQDHYYKVRKQDPATLTQFRRTVRFLYLNRHCFNGIYRTNTTGKFNVPFGGAKPNAIPPIETFRKCARLLATATIRTTDFGHVLRDTRAGDFVYLDPPYALGSRRVFRQYGPRDFGDADLSRLANHLRRMHERGVKFVLSYADCAEARNAFACWRPRRVRVRRHIAGFVASRRTAYELVATNICFSGATHANQ